MFYLNVNYEEMYTKIFIYLVWDYSAGGSYTYTTI